MAATRKHKRRDLLEAGCHAEVVALVERPASGLAAWCAGWRGVERELPDADETVMIFCPRGIEPVWLGYLDGETWRDVNGLALEGDEAPSHWAPMPDGPDEGRVS